MQFRLRLWPTLGTLIGLSMLLSLGTWQFLRYQEKAELESVRDQRVDSEPESARSLDELPNNFEHVTLHGRLDPEHLFLFKHRTDDGAPGGWLGALFEFADGGAVLVNLGWVHRERYDALSTDILEQYQPPLSGLVHQPARIVADEALRERLDALGELPRDEVIELNSYDLQALQSASTASMADPPTIVVLGAEHTQQPYPKASYEHVTEPYLTAERHLSYSVFWYVTGLALLAMYLGYGFGYLGLETTRRRRETTRD